MPEPIVKQQPDDWNVGMIATTLALTAIILATMIILLQAFYYGTQQREDRIKHVRQAAQTGAEQYRRDEERLQRYRWVDREQGTVGIPLERAIEQVLREEGPRSGQTRMLKERQP